MNERRWQRATMTANHYAEMLLGDLMLMPWKKLTADDIEGAYDKIRAKGRSPETVRGVHRALSSCLGWAEKKASLPHNPMRQVTTPHVAAPIVEIFDTQSWNALMEFAHEHDRDTWDLSQV